LDCIIGDPKSLPHPVEWMGRIIDELRLLTEKFSGESIFKLRLGGVLITFSLISISLLMGFCIERLVFSNYIYISSFGVIITIIMMGSCLAAKSLRDSILEVLDYLDKKDSHKHLELAKQKLSLIVGRDVWDMSKEEIFRACAETGSENSVDGVFAPLFWMIIGTILWNISPNLPGPLSLALVFKATSTMDSMIGYKEKNLIWIGSSAARLDDLLTFIPSRLVCFTLPIISNRIYEAPRIIKAALKDGKKDSSPNSGVSEAIFAYCARAKMGGDNYYKGKLTQKYVIAKEEPIPNRESVIHILQLSYRLELFWIFISFTFSIFTSITI
tara:strand:+ start:85 stop:1068 length:984 start_codon:yes stop_codon:yes gene_type:complete